MVRPRNCPENMHTNPGNCAEPSDLSYSDSCTHDSHDLLHRTRLHNRPRPNDVLKLGPSRKNKRWSTRIAVRQCYPTLYFDLSHRRDTVPFCTILLKRLHSLISCLQLVATLTMDALVPVRQTHQRAKGTGLYMPSWQLPEAVALLAHSHPFKPFRQSCRDPLANPG